MNVKNKTPKKITPIISVGAAIMANFFPGKPWL